MSFADQDARDHYLNEPSWSRVYCFSSVAASMINDRRKSASAIKLPHPRRVSIVSRDGIFGAVRRGISVFGGAITLGLIEVIPGGPIVFRAS